MLYNDHKAQKYSLDVFIKSNLIYQGLKMQPMSWHSTQHHLGAGFNPIEDSRAYIHPKKFLKKNINEKINKS